MGVVLMAGYLERQEALIARSVLHAAGIFAVIDNEDMLRNRPDLTLALGGYRLLVLEDEAVLREALDNPITEGGTFIVNGDLLDRVQGLVIGVLASAPCCIRQRRFDDPEIQH
jgi:hypothetical protein